MTALPDGWTFPELGEIAETSLGKMLDRGRSRGLPSVPYLRNVNVQWGRIDTDDVLTMELADEERERFGLRAGDLLVCEGGEIGRAAIWQGSESFMAYQKALHRVRPSAAVESRYLLLLFAYYASSGYLAQHATGSTIAHLPQQQLRRLRVPLPQVEEQRRIVDILEGHLSRLDAGEALLHGAVARLEALERRTVEAALLGQGIQRITVQDALADAGVDDGNLADLPAGWRWRRLGDLADVVGGVTKDSKQQGDPSYVEVPYLRVANVQRGYLDLSTVTTIRVRREKAKSLRLQTGDVLLNEGGDRDKLGRGWIWEGQIADCIHQNHVFRARVRDGVIEPRLLSWSANVIGGPWCERNGKQSVNLASISLSRIKLMPVPVPPLPCQRQMVDKITDLLAASERLRNECMTALRRSATLRQGLLQGAFSGRLTSSFEESVREVAAV